MSKSKHIHKYKLINLTRKKNKTPYLVYQCVMPLCSHYTPIKQAEGKLNVCNKCNDNFLISKETLHANGGYPLVHPRCLDCKKSDKTETLVDLSEFIDKVNKNV